MDNNNFNCMSYIIKQGDTLYQLSREYNVPIALILRANPYADVYSLRIGDEICIPVMNQVNEEDVFDYVVADGDSIQSIIEKHGINLEDLLRNNNLSDLYLMPGTTIRVPVSY